MCHYRDWQTFEAQKKDEAREAKAAEERRKGVIDMLLSDANREGEKAKPEAAPAREVAPAK